MLNKIMDYKLIYDQSKDLLEDYNKNKNKSNDHDDHKFREDMKLKYDYIFCNINSIFELCITGKMELKILEYMISQAEDIQKNNISSHDAEVKVGEKLVDKYVKPLTKK